jgi:hypothetical protein
MTEIKFYCVTNKKINFLNKKNYNLAWVGKNNPPKNYLTCDKGDNIFHKEKHYSELTFHYWYWKNKLRFEKKNQWIGFCQKRRFWVNLENTKKINKKNINKFLISKTKSDWNNYDAIICKSINVSNVKKIKIIKRGWKNLIKDPSILFNKKKRNIKLHFDMHHGYKNLSKAINRLNKIDKKGFENYVMKENNFNPHIMFITKPDLMNKWFLNLFSWLKKCEKDFQFNNLKGYDTGRLFAYLAERYLSYWFKKNFKCKEENWVQLKNF